MWGWHRKTSRGRTEPFHPMVASGAETATVAEACAVVQGRAAETYQAVNHPVPRWAWLNALAHRPPEQL
ncbi:MAG: hypothetical protein ACRDZY_12515, partial [Acidimicrobiales bacterium]